MINEPKRINRVALDKIKLHGNGKTYTSVISTEKRQELGR